MSCLHLFGLSVSSPAPPHPMPWWKSASWMLRCSRFFTEFLWGSIQIGFLWHLSLSPSVCGRRRLLVGGSLASSVLSRFVFLSSSLSTYFTEESCCTRSDLSALRLLCYVYINVFYAGSRLLVLDISCDDHAWILEL